MLYNHTKEKSIKTIAEKITARISTPDRNGQFGKDGCNCETEGSHGAAAAYMAFPTDTTTFLLGCIPCGTIHEIGE